MDANVASIVNYLSVVDDTFVVYSSNIFVFENVEISKLIQK